MYAVVSTGGKQYRVEPGATIAIEKLSVEPGATVTFDRVLLVGDGDETTVGAPTVAGATVSGTVLEANRGPKLVIFKFKQKVKYRRHTGHRQQLTHVRIDEITQDGKTVKASEAAGEEVAPEPQAADEAKARPRRKRATASATEPEAEKPVERKRTITRRSPPRKKAEPEE